MSWRDLCWLVAEYVADVWPVPVLEFPAFKKVPVVIPLLNTSLFLNNQVVHTQLHMMITHHVLCESPSLVCFRFPFPVLLVSSFFPFRFTPPLSIQHSDIIVFIVYYSIVIVIYQTRQFGRIWCYSSKS